MRCVVLTVCLVLAAFNQPLARTWHVDPAGGGDAPTIEAAIDSSRAGDVIELGCGTYYEWNLYPKNGTVIRSASGQPECVTVNGQFRQISGAIFQCWYLDSATRLEGLTITGGLSVDPFFGATGGGLVINDADLWLMRCRITGNRAKSGGGLSIGLGSQPTLVECDITGNTADFDAGGVVVWEGVFTAYDTRIAANLADLDPREGRVATGGEAHFHCCETDLEEWSFEGPHLVDDENCDPTSSESRTWSSVKTMYRR